MNLAVKWHLKSNGRLTKEQLDCDHDWVDSRGIDILTCRECGIRADNEELEQWESVQDFWEFASEILIRRHKNLKQLKKDTGPK